MITIWYLIRGSPQKISGWYDLSNWYRISFPYYPIPKTIQQRNALLKAFQKNRYFDADSLDIYQHHLIKSGNIIHEKRKSFNEKFSPIVQKFYQLISDGKEDIEINYQSDLSEQDFEAIWSRIWKKTEYWLIPQEVLIRMILIFLCASSH